MTAAARRSAAQRVVVTGIGLVTSLGVGWQANWRAAVAGTSGAGRVEGWDGPLDTASTIGCHATDFDATDFIDRKAARRMDRFCHLAVAAGRLAMDDARLTVSPETSVRAGVILGSGIGGLQTFTDQTLLCSDRGPDRVSPFFIPMVIANMGAAQVSMSLGLRGPLACTTTACASGNHAIGDATDAIRLGRADVMLAGGAEASITRMGMAAFNAMRALSTRNDDPARASRPFDADRDGFVMGEAGAILVLESLEHAVRRGAQVYCEVLGYGLTGDAHHLTEPDPTGTAPAAAITMALDEAGIAPEQVQYVNAHATSTPVGDSSEIRVLKQALGADVAARTLVSSTKSMHGHCLGAAGGVEGALTALVIREGVVPPTINLDNLDPACVGVDHVANVAREARVDTALSTAFGFGGHNATLVLGRPDDAE